MVQAGEQTTCASLILTGFVSPYTSTAVQRLVDAAKTCAKLGLAVYAGHGLNLLNVAPVAAILEISEFNIGHSIIADALFVGMQQAVARMKTAIAQARAEAAG